MTVSQQLGDSHNFGRRVELRGERIAKPRTLLWEWLLLSNESPLRKLLNEAAARDALGTDAFGFLPTLEFFGSRGPEGGEVERLQLEPLRASDVETRRALSSIVGRSLALWSWLGVADLHWENLVLGVDPRGQLVFGPLDIEMILGELSLPTETKLLPDADPEYAAICRHASGVRRVLPYLGKPIAVADLLTMAAAYRSTLTFLNRHSPEIAAIFKALPELHEAPLRVLLRGTGDYVQASSSALWPPLLEAESEQLARGDIPYFFRLYGRPGIHYFADATLGQIARLPLAGDVPQLDPMLQLSRDLRSPARKKLQVDGLFTVLGAVDHESFTGKHVGEELTLTFSKRNLVLTLPNHEQLQVSRNLRSFVGSVYLPCECGEVSGVFVPPLSVCTGARGSV